MRAIGQASRVALLALALGLGTTAAGAAEEANHLYLTVDKTQVIAFRSPTLTRVAITNPAIADVHVISPTHLLVNGKAPGTTSLLVFHSKRIERFDVVVQPAPTVPPQAPLVQSDEHAVEVLRAGKTSQQLFVRDTERAWVQLGTPVIESEATKK